MSCVNGFNNLVKFINIKDYVIDVDNLKYITVEFIVDKKVKVTCKDVIAIFPESQCDSLNSIDFHNITAFEHMLKQPVIKEERRYKMDISLKGANGLETAKNYRFLYFNDIQQPLGKSKSFKFISMAHLSEMKETSFLLDPSVNQFNNNEGDLATKEAINEGKKHWVRQFPRNVQEEFLNKANERNEKVEVELHDKPQRRNNTSKHNQDVQDHSRQARRMAVQSGTPRQTPSDRQRGNQTFGRQTGCSNCQRVGQLLRTQSDLYQQIKNLAEKNYDLEKEVMKLREALELAHVANKKLTLINMHEREMKKQFQSVAYQPIICVYHILEGFDSFQRPIYSTHPVMQYTQQVLVQNAHQPLEHGRPAQERQRFDDRLKLNNLKLKAIIGNQEERIRVLTEKLAELENNQEPKLRVNAVVKDVPIVEKAQIDHISDINDGGRDDE